MKLRQLVDEMVEERMKWVQSPPPDLKVCQNCRMVFQLSNPFSQHGYFQALYDTWFKSGEGKYCVRCRDAEREKARLADWAKEHPEQARICKAKADAAAKKVAK